MHSSKYQSPAMCGFIGLLLVASPLVFRLPLNFSKFNLQGSEEMEQYRAQQKADTAKKLDELGIMPSFTKLKVRRYLDNPKRNPKPDTTGFLEDEVVVVYDSAGRCIGQIENRKWLWKYHYKNVCQIK
ncbi:hypothetical protein VF14_03270 [Nostoc linckia z18]|jgi:hypothetical protein|uniref:Uncharacterized protein n=2 Tax=Nostoc linckia TaxID=92942 RepID=A0A9Q5ZH57_NOSLI|nr:hypothetical protein [Nostoc linckia]PHK42398.1 hypothetical protein VF12_03285 [Nostoc linckia z15]PHK46906.1 hypothetical protein VF13_07910 [Nostoc linckia z16]PHJ69168.1 hypothetical protein VF02_00740 [Nostoc linckia z1]PHJ73319.1 hypothetical protein VF05_01755 [Nostoc linckia z3]PHJ78666.1 hypothetical protein VF03_00740 [Nostoc linckia z2]